MINYNDMGENNGIVEVISIRFVNSLSLLDQPTIAAVDLTHREEMIGCRGTGQGVADHLEIDGFLRIEAIEVEGLAEIVMGVEAIEDGILILKRRNPAMKSKLEQHVYLSNLSVAISCEHLVSTIYQIYR